MKIVVNIREYLSNNSNDSLLEITVLHLLLDIHLEIFKVQILVFDMSMIGLWILVWKFLGGTHVIVGSPGFAPVAPPPVGMTTRFMFYGSKAPSGSPYTQTPQGWRRETVPKQCLSPPFLQILAPKKRAGVEPGPGSTQIHHPLDPRKSTLAGYELA